MRITDADWTIGFSPAVLEFLAARRTPSAKSFERAGQLFTSDLTSKEIVIDAVTDLRPISASAKHFRLNMLEADAQRALMFQQNRYFFGIWHTHIQSRPRPSCIDIEVCRDHALAAAMHLRGCLLAIVGTASFPEGLLVGAHDGQLWRETEVVCRTGCSRPSEPIG